MVGATHFAKKPRILVVFALIVPCVGGKREHTEHSCTWCLSQQTSQQHADRVRLEAASTRTIEAGAEQRMPCTHACCSIYCTRQLCDLFLRIRFKVNEVFLQGIHAAALPRTPTFARARPLLGALLYDNAIVCFACLDSAFKRRWRV